MKCTIVSYSLSEDPATLEEWEHSLKNEIRSLINEGNHVILYPELFLMGLAKYFSGELAEQYLFIHRYLEKKLYPAIKEILQKKSVLLVLGTGPRLVDGKIFNSSPVFIGDNLLFQDKLFLTPWETDFTPGSELHIFNFMNLKTAVIICFDSEQPDLALKLKQEGIDFILVPSATTNKNGSQRVNRCASSRAVELGAIVMTSPLVGDSKCDLIDHNEGRQGVFLPAQEMIPETLQEKFSAYSKDKKVVGIYDLDLSLMTKLKVKDDETKPFYKPVHPNLKINVRR